MRRPENPLPTAVPTRLPLGWSIGAAALMLGALAGLVPWWPALPQAGLDPSWMHALNEAVARGMVFGRDIVFTLGPYASVFTATYHPATDARMLAASLWLALCLGGCLLVAARGRGALRLCLTGALLAAPMHSRDALLFAVPLALVLAIEAWTRREPSARRVPAPLPPPGGHVWLLWAIAHVPLGLLPLVKGSLLPLCAVALVASLGLWGQARRPAGALAAVAGALIGSVGAWVLAGQPVGALADYLAGLLPLIGGFSEAMSVPGPAHEVYLYLALAVLILVAWAWPGRAAGPLVSRLPVGLTLAATLFLAFKAGYVRHDAHHVLIATGTGLLAAALVGLRAAPRRDAVLLLLALGVWFQAEQAQRGWGVAQVAAQWLQVPVRAFEGAVQRLRGEEDLRRAYEARLAEIRAAHPLPPLAGGVDRYSHGQSELLAAGLSWSPRPVFQSYTVYTPELAALNQRHLARPDAALHVLWRVEPIDGRLPALEDGASWPLLWRTHEVQAVWGELAWLTRRPTPLPEDAAVPFMPGASLRLGEAVALPEHGGVLQARVQARPTAAGRLLSWLYKTAPLRLQLELADGSVHTYRAPAGMLAAGFVLSPLVQDTRDLVLLATGRLSDLQGQRVRRLTLVPAHGPAGLWASEASLALQVLSTPEPVPSLPAGFFDPTFEGPPGGERGPVAERSCDGSFDALNGQPLAGSGAQRVPGRVLRVGGWVALSAAAGQVPAQVFLVLRGAQGEQWVSARRTPRPDVAAHFGRPDMPAPGFEAVANLAALPGVRELRIAVLDGGVAALCAGLRVDLQP